MNRDDANKVIMGFGARVKRLSSRAPLEASLTLSLKDCVLLLAAITVVLEHARKDTK